MNRRLALTCALFAILAFSRTEATASEAIPGPKVGDSFAHALAASDQAGKAQSLKTLMGSKGMALFFVRSADWCPFCKRQLADANTRLPEFRALGINVVSVSVDSVANIAAFASAQSIAYPMLADPAGDINKALGIRDEQYPVGSKAFGVPRPVIYVIDKAGKVRARFVEPTYRTRPDLNQVLAEIKALQLP